MSTFDKGAHPLLQQLFFWVVVKPVVLFLIGLNVRHRERLPSAGPAIVVANHNSHLDTLVLMSLLPARLLRWVRPVAAADYFLRNRALAAFSTRVIGILPVERGSRSRDPLAGASAALERDQIVILFPEGTRGEPERRARFKAGIGQLACAHPEVPVVPVFMHGLGKVLPRGSFIPIPFFADVFVGEPLYGGDDRRETVERLQTAMDALAAEGSFPPWE